MKKGSYLALLLAAALAVVTGCSSTSSPQPQTPSSPTETAAPTEGGSLTIASESEPGNLNPHIWATSSDTFVTHMIFDSLVIPDKELKMVGSLVEKWDVSEDGKTYTFHLQKNVKWHDGTPFTAKDVAFTFSSLAKPEYDAGGYWRVSPVVGAEEVHEGKAQEVTGIKVIDDHTISFTTTEKFAPFLSGLFIGIVPEHLLKDVSPKEWAKHDFNRNPVGTGPFQFVKWESGQYIELKANKEYFKGAPKLDKIVARFGDTNTMLAAFINREVDVAPVPIAEIPSIQSLDYAELKVANQLSMYYIGFNALNEHFQDKKVRQALAYAIDKQSIVSSILGEYGKVSFDVFPMNHWSHNPDVPQYPYDPAKAEALLQEAGYAKNGKGIYEKGGKELTFTLEVPTGKTEREKTAALIKQYFEKIGVNMELRALDFPTLVTKLLPKNADGTQRKVTADDYHAYILGFGVEADPDEYRSYFGSKYMPPNGYNFVSYSDPEVDQLLEQQVAEVDMEKRKSLFWEVGKKLAEDEIWIPLYEQEAPYVANKRLVGFDPDFRGPTFNAQDWAVTQ